MGAFLFFLGLVIFISVIMSIIVVSLRNKKTKYIIPAILAIGFIYCFAKAIAVSGWDGFLYVIFCIILAPCFIVTLLLCIIIDIREFRKKKKLTNRVEKRL